ncbi:MAG: UvrD-helicase domain-containing protein [Planctomycetota bacterium]|jgi:ATP-dependent helicase/nuclease subunit A
MIRLTREQEAAVHAAGDCVAVVAGAGTGKTCVLTERYLHLVLDRDVAPSRVLALTFTEKAAREMKDRMIEALQERRRSDLARAAEFAPISTIHAFLARILRERALDAGLDPRFAVADEMTAELYLEAALLETVDGLEPETRAVLVDLVGGEAFLRELYLAARATPLAMEELRPVAPDLDALRRRLAGWVEQPPATPVRGQTGRRLTRLQELGPRLCALDPACAEEFSLLVKGARGPWFQRGRALAKEFARLRHVERARECGAAVVEALRRLDATYTARKRADGLVDFSDLERCGLQLLRSPAGDAVAAEYDHVLVDEYQDTSRIQEAVLDRLAQGRQRFGVGDEKQSIYRFRYADAAVFQQLRENAERHPLGGSFRSRPELLQFTNALFRRLFRGRDVEPQDLHAEAEWRPKEGPCVEVIAPGSPDAGVGRRREALALARRLHDLVANRELSITDARRPPRPLSFRDCALLIRATTHLGVYERALADAGVPYVVIQGRGYYAAREVVDLAHLLLLLADPHDGYRAVAAMTSLLCGVPDGDLLHLTGVDPLPLRALAMARPEAIPAVRWERLRTFAERFGRWRRRAARGETGDLIEAILRETRFADLLLLEPDGRRRHANLRKALRRARQCRDDPAAYARSLLEFRERERRESEAPIASEADEVVKVMTVHAAKGLEFPLVAVPDLTAGHRNGRGCILRADGVFGFKLREGDDSVAPPGLAGLAAWEKEQEANERLRLLYVALTRAGEHLLLSGGLAPHAHRELLEPLVKHPPPEVRVVDTRPLLAAPRRARGAAAVRAAVRRMADLPADLPRDAAGAGALLERIEQRARPATDDTPYVAAVADLVEFHRCPRRYRLRRMLGIELDDADEVHEAADAEEHPRRELGTLFHELMCARGPGAIPDAETIGLHLPAATARDVAKIRQWSAWLADQGIVRRLQGVEQQREMSFLARVAGLPVRGVIDLYAPDPPLLLDYKTGARVRTDEYWEQVAIYLAALNALGLRAPDRAHLVYVDAEKTVEIEARPVDDLVERFVAAHREGGGFPPEPGAACLHCEFRQACAADGVPVETTPGLFD